MKRPLLTRLTAGRPLPLALLLLTLPALGCDDVPRAFAEQPCAHSMACLAKQTTTSPTPLADPGRFFGKLSLANQVRVAFCSEQVQVTGQAAKQSNREATDYYQYIDATPDELARHSDELARQGHSALAAAYALAAYRRDPARAYLERAIKRFPLTQWPSVTLALLDERMQRFLQDRDSDAWMAHLLEKASLYRLMGQYDDALKEYQKGIQILPNTQVISAAELYLLMGQMALKVKDFSVAQQFFQAALERVETPAKRGDYHFWLAQALLGQAHYLAALPHAVNGMEAMQHQQDQSPSPGTALVLSERQLQLANTLRGLERFDQAGELYDTVIASQQALMGAAYARTAQQEKIKLLYRLGEYAAGDALAASLPPTAASATAALPTARLPATQTSCRENTHGR